MTKTEAIELFGGESALRAALGGISRQAVWRWPTHLSDHVEGRVLVAAMRTGVDVSKYTRTGADISNRTEENPCNDL